MLEDLFSATVGLLIYSKEKAEELIEILVDKGEMQRDEAKKLVNRLVEKGKTEADRYREQFRNKYNDTVKEKIITKEDFRRLENKIDQLIALLQEKQ
jgi:polyhydroxyalkanoate synthesis regulator phasin